MQIQVFKFKEKEVRTKIINNKEYFCASDVCQILEIRNARDVVNKLDSRDVEKSDILTKGGKQQASFVNEVGLYYIIFKSTKPEARLFKRWIFEKVLPEIRKTGGYNIEKITMKDLAYKIIESEEQKEKMRLQIEERDKHIEEQDKQITYYDEMLIAEGSFCLQDGAKILHLRPNKFIEALRIKGYLTKSDLAQQDYINNGCFITKTVIIDNNRGVKKEKKQARITAKGIAYFAKKVLTDFADILDKPTSKKIFEKIKKNDKENVVLTLLNNYS